MEHAVLVNNKPPEPLFDKYFRIVGTVFVDADGDVFIVSGADIESCVRLQDGWTYGEDDIKFPVRVLSAGETVTIEIKE